MLFLTQKLINKKKLTNFCGLSLDKFGKEKIPNTNQIPEIELATSRPPKIISKHKKYQ